MAKVMSENQDWDIESLDLPVIRFQGEDLPRYAYYLDLAAKLLSADAEDDQVWFWRFVICIGIEKTAACKEVAEKCSGLLDAVRNAAATDILVAFGHHESFAMRD